MGTVKTYTPEVTAKLIEDFKADVPIASLAEELGVPERSVIAKLSSLGLYKRKGYLTKQGEPTIKKEEYIERIAQLLNVAADRLESLEKANKNVLKLIEVALTPAEWQKPLICEY